MQPITVTIGPIAAADDNGIAEAQTQVGAGDLTLDGALVTDGVAIMDVPRHVAVTSSGNDTGVHFTIYGTSFSGASVSETVQGTNGGVAATSIDFLTVTRVYADGSTADNVIVGTNGAAGSRWVRLDSWADAQTAIQCTVSGTVNYTLQTTMNDPNDPFSPVDVSSVVWLNTNDGDAVTAIGNVSSNFDWTPTYARVLLNSGAGSVSAVFSQFNAVNK